MELIPLGPPKITEDFVRNLLDTTQLVIPGEQAVYKKLHDAETEGIQLNIKMGFDPTSPDLHLGHAVSMRQLKRFQDLGHNVIIIIGDFTGLIGDPSGRNKSRPLASKEELDRNAETYIEQLGKILDTSNIEVRRNSEWLSEMSLEDIIRLLAQGSLSQVISREDFRSRLDSGSPIGLHEIIYPFLQGMDSVNVKADIEIGGIDQLYAFQAARMLQTNLGEDPQASIFMPLLRGLDGHKKMSKSLGNYVGLSDEPKDMFGKIMSIPDSLIEEYLKLASGFTSDEVKRFMQEIERGTNPIEVKLRLAHNITTTYHNEEKATQAEEYFNKQFRLRNESREFISVEVDETGDLVDLLLNMGVENSRSKVRKLIQQGAVTVDGTKATIDNTGLATVEGLKIKIGKKRFFETHKKQ